MPARHTGNQRIAILICVHVHGVSVVSVCLCHSVRVCVFRSDDAQFSKKNWSSDDAETNKRRMKFGW